MSSQEKSERLKKKAKKRLAEKGRRGLRQRPVAWQYPDGIERSYVAEVRRFTKDFNSYLYREIVGRLRSLSEEAEKTRGDDGQIRLDATWPQRVNKLIRDAQVFGKKRASEIDPRVYAHKVTKFNKVQRNRIIRSVLGVEILTSEPWLRPLMSSWVNENRKLIVTLPQRTLDDLEGIILRGLRTGRSVNQLTSEVVKRYKNSESRARLIARDQLGKLNGDLTRYRQTDLGIKRFIWRSSMDERVREEHRERNGKTYLWDKPPDGEIPGFPINCRCYAEPDLSDLSIDKE